VVLKSARLGRTVACGLLAWCWLAAAACHGRRAEPPNDQAEVAATVERLDAAANAIVPAGARIRRLATGLTWTEGPIWVQGGYLLFADIPSNTIRRIVPGQPATIWLQPSGHLGSAPFKGREPGSNGMTLDVRGRLTVAGHAQRDVYRVDSLGDPARHTILADTYRGKRLNSPNDLVYRSDGSLYFTDPPYGLEMQNDSDPLKELKVNGVYRLAGALEHPAGAAPDRAKLQLVVADLPRPNGIAFSPDEKLLYVSNTGPRKLWMRYPVKPDGTLGAGAVFFDASSDPRPGSPDGIKVDTAGNLYGAGPGGVWIFSPAGKHLATIVMPEVVSNLNWGGADGRSLFITASSSVYRIDLQVPGVRP
jgi:gluconolactonase